MATYVVENTNRLTWSQKVRKGFSNITVEPILAAYVFANVLANLATQNLNLEKACRVNLNYSTEICDALTNLQTENYKEEEQIVQQLVARMLGYKTIISSSFPCILILFWGSWSDRNNRRKPCIIIPIIGEIIGVFSLMLCVYFEQSSLEVVTLMEPIFPALSGGIYTIAMGSFSYVSVITSEEDRTFRVAIMNLCFSVGVPIGRAVSGVLLEQVGFYGIYSIAAVLYVFALFHAVVNIKEPETKQLTELGEGEKKKNKFIDFFNMVEVFDGFKVVFKKGENKRRLRVFLLMMLVLVVNGPMQGEYAVVYLFTRYQFNWSAVEFSFYSTYAMLTGFLGVMFCIGIIVDRMKMNDILVGAFTSISKILSSFVYAFAVASWQMYVGAIVEMCYSASFVIARSLATKIVNTDELGKVCSFVALVESVTPLIFGPLYTNIYASTISFLPGTFYLVGNVFSICAVLIFIWMWNFQRKYKNQSSQDQISEDQLEKDVAMSKKIDNDNRDTVEVY